MNIEPCIPFPLSWERNVDFVPLLSLQAKLNEEQNLFHFQGHVSHGSSISQEPVKTDLGVAITPSVSQRTGFDVSFGSLNPNVENGIPQKEIWKNIVDWYPEVPEVAIHTKGIVHDVPNNMMLGDGLDGVDYLFQKQISIGNRYRRIRQQTQLQVINPLNIVRDGLYVNGIISPSDPCMRRIRSVLTTDYILPSNNRGYNRIKPNLFDIERMLRGKTHGQARGHNWWEDTAIPQYLDGQINSTRINFRVCILDDRHCLIGI